MPIYLDRHDTPDEITPEHVAEMHQADLKVQDEYGCRGFTYWFDDKRKTGFCLIEAPNKDALIKMHDHAHGAIPHQIIEVEEHFVEAFLGRLEDPKVVDGQALIISESAFRIIVVSTIKQTSLLKDSKNGDKRNAFINAMVHVAHRFNGSIVKKNGGDFLISFANLKQALECALELQSEFLNYVGQSADTGLHLKVGIHCGNPVTEKTQLFEDTIKLAERMCAIAKGSIVISSESKSLAQAENISLLKNKKLISALSHSNEIFLDQLMDFMEVNWNKTELKIDDFCKGISISKSSFYRMMKSLNGKSPNTFIKDYRLDKSLALLYKQKATISEITFECGFNSPAYFSKCFQDKYGIPPSVYTRRISDSNYH